jgi:hypothetical protein
MSNETEKPLAEALEKLTDLVHKFTAPSASELGEMLRDRIKMYYVQRQLRWAKRTVEMIREAGFSPKPVTLKLLFPTMDYAALEEDDELQDLWAALMANAADPENSEPVRVYFPEILKELTIEHARLLNDLYTEQHHQQEGQREKRLFVSGRKWEGVEIHRKYVMIAEPDKDFAQKFASPQFYFGPTEAPRIQKHIREAQAALENLLRLRLLVQEHFTIADAVQAGVDFAERAVRHRSFHSRHVEGKTYYHLSVTALDLVAACIEPKKKRAVTVPC